jgi:hypothetical protein
MKCNRLCACVLALILCAGLFSATAFALVEEPASTEAVATEPATETVPEAAEESDEDTKPLTPEGNLTLVDDVGSATQEGKQFITVVTKSGNYFYLIIDRDKEGEQTVHFLNLVDEADLLELLDEEEAAQYTAVGKEVEPDPEPEPEEEAEQPEAEEKSPVNILPTMVLLLAFAGVGGFFGFQKWQAKKKEKEQAKPDPDADYVDEEDYGYAEPEDDDDDPFPDEEDEDMDGSQ